MKGTIIFFGGAAIGGLVGWLVTKKVYTKKIAEVRNIYAELTSEAKGKKEEPIKTNESVGEVVSSLGYSSIAVPPYPVQDIAPVEVPDNEPYIIADERFEGDPKYQKHYLVYSTENDELYEGEDAIFTVYDNKGEPEDLTVMDILGEDFMEEALYTGGADIIHVRNESLQMDFEVEVIR